MFWTHEIQGFRKERSLDMVCLSLAIKYSRVCVRRGEQDFGRSEASFSTRLSSTLVRCQTHTKTRCFEDWDWCIQTPPPRCSHMKEPFRLSPLSGKCERLEHGLHLNTPDVAAMRCVINVLKTKPEIISQTFFNLPFLLNCLHINEQQQKRIVEFFCNINPLLSFLNENIICGYLFL